MKRYLWIATLVIVSAAPVFAQQQNPEESALQELGMGALFADGNLFLRQVQRGDDPVQQLKRFFQQAKMPLNSTQQRGLEALLDKQIEALVAAGQNQEAVRKANQDFTRKSNEIFSSEQRAELRRYRTEQIMMRGGFPALQFTLEEAQTPMTLDQERQVLAVYTEFQQQVTQLQADSKGVPNRAELDKLENSALGKVVRLLTPVQRKALATSRQGSLVSKIRP